MTIRTRFEDVVSGIKKRTRKEEPKQLEAPKPEIPKHKTRALILMKQQSRYVPTTGPVSGEYKAHQVYARLIKEFPEIRKCDLRFTIEELYQEFFRNVEE